MRKPILLLIATFTLRLNAATYHVAIDGSNGSNGLAVATAWATIQHAADLALAGDSVVVHDGNYQGFAAMTNSGTVDDPIVFLTQEDAGGVFIDQPCSYNNLDGINVENVEWVVVEGFEVNFMPRTGIRTALSDHVTLRSNSCSGNVKWGILTGFAEHCIIEYNVCSYSSDEHGIYFGNSADAPIIRYNHCFNNHANGIHMNGDESQGGDGVISNAQVYGNVIYQNGTGGGSGINCDGVINSVFYNNLIYENHASGISLYRIDAGAPSTGNRVYNNTIVNAVDARWCVNITDGCTNNQVLNNVLINQHPFRGSIVVAADALTGFVTDLNLVTPRLSPDGDATILDLAAWQALGYDANSQVADAQAQLFIPGAYYPLGPTAQMVDAGTSAVSGVVIDDLGGVLRPQGAAYDIGCYELMDGMGVAEANATSPYRLCDDALLIAGDRSATRLTVYDAMGRVIHAATIANSERRLQLPRAHGMVVLVITNANGQPIWTGRSVLE